MPFAAASNLRRSSHLTQLTRLPLPTAEPLRRLLGWRLPRQSHRLSLRCECVSSCHFLSHGCEHRAVNESSNPQYIPIPKSGKPPARMESTPVVRAQGPNEAGRKVIRFRIDVSDERDDYRRVTARLAVHRRARPASKLVRRGAEGLRFAANLTRAAFLRSCSSSLGSISSESAS